MYASSLDLSAYRRAEKSSEEVEEEESSSEDQTLDSPHEQGANDCFWMDRFMTATAEDDEEKVSFFFVFFFVQLVGVHRT
jgi:hypothetical protein